MVKPSMTFVKKTLTTLVLAPLVLAVIYYGYPWFHMVLLAVGAMLSWEWAHMVPNKKPCVFALLYFLSMVFAVFIGPLSVALMGVLLVMLVASVKAKDEKKRKLLILGVPYISVGLGAISLLVVNDAILFLWMLLAVWCTDIGGYVFGCSIKGPKLAPKISPNKTWSGFFGGMILAMVVTVLFQIFIIGNGEFVFDKNMLVFGLMGAYVAVLAQIGDLVESAVKRNIGVKDSSDMIPGHGGFFDRLDSVLFTVPVFIVTAALVEYLVIKFGF